MVSRAQASLPICCDHDAVCCAGARAAQTASIMVRIITIVVIIIVIMCITISIIIIIIISISIVRIIMNCW